MAFAKIGGGQNVFVNPPYGREIKDWVRKSYEESRKPNTKVVMLIPARTDTTYFHDYIYHKAEIRFLKGRLHFNDAGPAPFPSMIVVFDHAIDKAEIKAQLKSLEHFPIRERFNNKCTGTYDPNFPRRKAFEMGYIQAVDDYNFK